METRTIPADAQAVAASLEIAADRAGSGACSAADKDAH
jgi:hypothetical protein